MSSIFTLILYTLSFYLILDLAFTVSTCSNRYIKQKESSNDERKIEEPYHCNRTIINPKVIINPYGKKMNNYVGQKPFASICLKCKICLAIAKEMDSIFLRNAEKIGDKKYIDAIPQLNKEIASLCETGFRYYDLRKFKQFQLIIDDSNSNRAKHISTNVDGEWTRKSLRETCSVYSTFLDTLYLIHSYKHRSDNVSDYLCNSGGIYRDCISMNLEKIQFRSGEDVLVTHCLYSSH